FICCLACRHLHSFPTRRSSDLALLAARFLFTILPCASRLGNLTDLPPVARDALRRIPELRKIQQCRSGSAGPNRSLGRFGPADRSEEHTSELQSQSNLVCRLLL